MFFLLAQLSTTDPATATRPALVDNLHQFLNGGTFGLYIVAAIMFVRFHRKSHDRLFLFFAAAFAIFSVNRLAFFWLDDNDEVRTLLYVVRLIAFALIIYAIVDKNRAPRSRLAARPSDAGPPTRL